MPKPAPGKPSNFRLSARTIHLLEEIAKKTGLTKTQVVELAVGDHAKTIPELRDQAKKLLMELAAKNLQANDTEQPIP